MNSTKKTKIIQSALLGTALIAMMTTASLPVVPSSAEGGCPVGFTPIPWDEGEDPDRNLNGQVCMKGVPPCQKDSMKLLIDDNTPESEPRGILCRF